MKVWERDQEKLRKWWNEQAPQMLKEYFFRRNIDVPRKMWHQLTDDEKLMVWKLYNFGLVKDLNGQIVPVEG